MTTFSVVGAVAGASGFLSAGSSSGVMTTLADPLAYIKGVASVNYGGMSARVQAIAEGLARFDATYTYNDPTHSVSIDVSQSVANSFTSTALSIAGDAKDISSAMSDDNPLSDVAAAIPGPASMDTSLLIPNIIGLAERVLLVDMQNAAKQIGAACTKANTGSWDQDLRTVFSSFGMSQTDISRLLSYVKGYSGACSTYSSRLTPVLPAGGPVNTYQAKNDSAIASFQNSLQGARSAIVTGAVVAAVLSVLTALGLSVWTFLAVRGALQSIQQSPGGSSPEAATYTLNPVRKQPVDDEGLIAEAE